MGRDPPKLYIIHVCMHTSTSATYIFISFWFSSHETNRTVKSLLHFVCVWFCGGDGQTGFCYRKRHFHCFNTCLDWRLMKFQTTFMSQNHVAKEAKNCCFSCHNNRFFLSLLISTPSVNLQLSYAGLCLVCVLQVGKSEWIDWYLVRRHVHFVFLHKWNRNDRKRRTICWWIWAKKTAGWSLFLSLPYSHIIS